MPALPMKMKINVSVQLLAVATITLLLTMLFKEVSATSRQIEIMIAGKSVNVESPPADSPNPHVSKPPSPLKRNDVHSSIEAEAVAGAGGQPNPNAPKPPPPRHSSFATAATPGPKCDRFVPTCPARAKYQQVEENDKEALSRSDKTFINSGAYALTDHTAY